MHLVVRFHSSRAGGLNSSRARESAGRLIHLRCLRPRDLPHPGTWLAAGLTNSLATPSAILTWGPLDGSRVEWRRLPRPSWLRAEVSAAWCRSCLKIPGACGSGAQHGRVFEFAFWLDGAGWRARERGTDGGLGCWVVVLGGRK